MRQQTGRDAAKPIQIVNIMIIDPQSLEFGGPGNTQPQYSALEATVMTCRCGWSIEGVIDIDGDAFMGFPETQVWPERRLDFTDGLETPVDRDDG